MSKPTQINKVTREILEKYPNSSKRALSELLFENYPTLFASSEHARAIIKHITCKYSNYKNKINHKTDFDRINPFGLNYSKAKERQFVTIPTAYNNILWLSDIHFPNHDIKALTSALNYGIENKINCIVLGGDILDNEPFTNHDAPPPSKNDVLDWFEMVEDFLDMLKSKFPKAKIYWLEGNHDNWYVRYLMKKAPMLFGDEYYRLPQRLNLKSKGIDFLEQNIILKAGKLQLLHGHTVVRGVFPPVNPARGVFLKTKSSTLIGHVHQNSYHPERNLKGDIIGCWSVGCLCTLAPDYDPHNTKHGNGFAHIQTKPNGHFKVELKEIFEGEIL